MIVSRSKLAALVLAVMLASSCSTGAIDVPPPASQSAVPPESPTGIRSVQLPPTTAVAALPGEDTSKIEPPVNAPSTSSTQSEKTSAAPDKVEVVLFHQRILCSCMDVQRGNIENAARLSAFQDEPSSGKLAFVDVIIDDGANKTLVRKFNATSFDLYIRTLKGSEETIYPINYAIGWANDVDRLTDFFKKTLRSVLDGGLP